jgi:hypothetical protein
MQGPAHRDERVRLNASRVKFSLKITILSCNGGRRGYREENCLVDWSQYFLCVFMYNIDASNTCRDFECSGHRLIEN